jgi:hypothetical protein
LLWDVVVLLRREEEARWRRRGKRKRFGIFNLSLGVY